MTKGGDVMVELKDSGIASLVEQYQKLYDLFIREEFVILSKDELVDKLNMNKKEIIENHKKTHVVEPGKGADKRYYTYVPDPSKPNGLRQIKKTEEEDIYDAIVDWYVKADNPKTLEELYPKWLEYKAEDTSLANAHSLSHDWDTFYKGDLLTKRKMASIKVPELKQWLLRKVKEHNLTRRGYNDLKTVINSMFDYAVGMGYVSINVARQVPKVSAKHFVVEVKRDKTERVYLENEVASLINVCLERFKRTHNTAYLGICLNLYLGLRVGELVALKVSDFKGSFVHIEREEIKHHEMKGVEIIRDGYEVAPHCKTPDGERDIPLAPQAHELVSMIVAENERKGFQSEYLFLDKKTGQRMHNDGINNVMRKYVNTALDTPQKANHSLRRTWITILIASGKLTLKEISKLAGHHEVSTTLKWYLDSIKTDDSVANAVEEALSCISVIPSNTSVIPVSSNAKAPETQ